MIDLHCHILHDVDDGADSIEESMAMARIAVDDGITDLIATPHFMEEDVSIGAPYIKERLSLFKKKLEDGGIPLRVHQGSEIQLSPDTLSQLERGDAASLAGSRYVLTELPFFEIPIYAEEMIYRMRLSGYIPIIAHPERNRIITENPNRLLDFLELGALAQVNAGSILGKNGKAIRQAAEIMLTHNMVHCIASDGHHKSRRRPILSEGRKAAGLMVGSQKAKRLIETVPEKILKDEDFLPEKSVRYAPRKNIFSLFAK
ncbi:MAG TPA: CpsB/CapC family capsule biosynthesis tyrosine phosphatase [Clostridia bacterium]|nr:CpsB/CapC family capsule biosynthesis tyrosine phosphatase [Clostridia bacterium]